jgi:hypothetical protein
MPNKEYRFKELAKGLKSKGRPSKSLKEVPEKAKAKMAVIARKLRGK